MWSVSIAGKVTGTIGISVCVGFITSLTKKAEFVENMLSEEDKKRIAKKSLHQDNGMDGYLDQRIDALSNLTFSYKENCFYDIRISSQDDCLIETVTCEYINYGTMNIDPKKKNQLSCYFDNDISHLISFKLTDTEDASKYEVFDENKILQSKTNIFGSIFKYEEYVKIPKIFRNYKKIRVEKSYRQVRKSHWITSGIVLTNPIHNINITITIDDSLSFREKNITGDERFLSVSQVSEKMIKISSSEWVPSYTGIFILVAKKNEIDDQI